VVTQIGCVAGPTITYPQQGEREAMKHFERALELGRSDDAASLQLGLLHYEMGGQAMPQKQAMPRKKYDAAVAHYRAAAKVRPDSAAAFNNLGHHADEPGSRYRSNSGV
jgi:tetratricopeptide (TPR) repeat protein